MHLKIIYINISLGKRKLYWSDIQISSSSGGGGGGEKKIKTEERFDLGEAEGKESEDERYLLICEYIYVCIYLCMFTFIVYMTLI
jgi:hypothetical protein